VPFESVVEGLRRAQQMASMEFGISSKLILCFLRHLPADAAMQTLHAALPFRDWIAGVGLDSSEAGHPPEKFSEVFRVARAEGFKAVAHAGEEGPAGYIWQALDLLGVSRIDHGVRCAEDQKLLERLRDARIPLTVCPLSNVKLRVFSSMERHNIRALLEAGLCVTVNSDDPAYFGGYVTENYLAIQRALNFSQDQIRQFAANAIEASFLDARQKERLRDELGRYAQKNAAVPAAARKISPPLA